MFPAERTEAKDVLVGWGNPGILEDAEASPNAPSSRVPGGHCDGPASTCPG